MRVSGVVRWFDRARGYGFLDADDGKGDIHLHVNVLHAFGLSSVGEGWRLWVDVETTAKGRRAGKIYDAQPPPGQEEPPPDAGPLQPAKVRWFDPVEGYGFVNVFGSDKDVFLHMATLRAFGMGAVVADAALLVRVKMTPRGLTAVEVRPWNHVNPPDGPPADPDGPVPTT